jgi:D-alanyl-D-alanine carboxypeptidase
LLPLFFSACNKADAQSRLGTASPDGELRQTETRSGTNAPLAQVAAALKNAARYGWSLSFLNGYEHVTGYRWKSWHYRYVGPALAASFDDIQQYALQFILAYGTPS